MDMAQRVNMYAYAQNYLFNPNWQLITRKKKSKILCLMIKVERQINGRKESARESIEALHWRHIALASQHQ